MGPWIAQAIERLIVEQRIELVPEASAAEVSADIAARALAAPPHSQLGAVLMRALCESELVSEVYASELELVRALQPS